MEDIVTQRQFFTITLMLAIIIALMLDPDGVRYSYRIAIAKVEYAYSQAIQNLIAWLRHLAA
jgi:hypothetical protein